MKLYSALAVSAALFTASIAMAQSTPAGTEGKDWARKAFRISSGGAVTLTATNSTVNAQSGNSTRILLRVNGAEIKDVTADKASFSTSYVVSGNGRYEAEAICYNARADAYTCTLTAKKVEEEEF